MLVATGTFPPSQSKEIGWLTPSLTKKTPVFYCFETSWLVFARGNGGVAAPTA